uniref:Ig-like domain-containing protein n=1 Tax=Periophthalmus magnuspinnatus TaxID=409849 RepID=A0A3B3ZP76_9GOBI
MVHDHRSEGCLFSCTDRTQSLESVLRTVFPPGLCSGVGVLPQSRIDAAVGDSVMFTTFLDPIQTPFTSIRWMFGTKDITSFDVTNTTAPEYEGRVTLYMSTGSLQLRNVTLNDTGEYNVTITRADGTVMNGLTTLNVWGFVIIIVLWVPCSDSVLYKATQVRRIMWNYLFSLCIFTVD